MFLPGSFDDKFTYFCIFHEFKKTRIQLSGFVSSKVTKYHTCKGKSSANNKFLTISALLIAFIESRTFITFFSCSKLIRGHCVFWAVDTEVPDWVKNIPNYKLKAKLKERLKNLLGRYRGRFVYIYQSLFLLLLWLLMRMIMMMMLLLFFMMTIIVHA